MATEQRGVIYYKLDPDYHYEGDYTKNCGVNGAEIDGNFHFLRGYDISSFDVSDNKEELVITRLNGEKMTVNLREEFEGYDFAYDNLTGVLTVTNPFGETKELEGFLSDRKFHVYGDYTIDGEGSRYNPIRVSSIAKTGTYRPAKAVLDFVSPDSTDALPTQHIELNERYVTKEKVSRYGLLYPISGVRALQARLEEIGSEWRVPTKEDWDNLLNIVENCNENANHDSESTNVYLGKDAGAYLKSNTQWKPFYRKLQNGEIVLEGERFSRDNHGNYTPNPNGEYLKVISSEDKYGFSIFPVGFGGRRGADSIGGYGEWAAYWSATEEDNNQDMFVKVFTYDERGVEQNTWGRDCYLSLRLVKDYTGDNLYDVETVDGMTVTTKHFPLTDDDEKNRFKNTLVWTCENVAFTNEEYNGEFSREWPDIEGVSYDVRYFVNDWDGSKWVKSQLREGESIVLLDENDVKMHEWRLVDGVLIDTVDILRRELAKDINALNEKIDKVAEGVAKNEERIEILEIGLEDEIANRKNADVELSNRIDAEKEERIAADDELENRIANEESARIAEDEEINRRIDEEILNREAEDEVLRNAINDERNERIAADAELGNRIDVEKEERVAADVELGTRIDVEKEERVAADDELSNRIDVEKEERVAEDAVLQKQISENKVETYTDSGIVVTPHEYVDGKLEHGTKISVKLPEVGMIKVDAEGLYFDGNFNFGNDWEIANE